MMASYSDIDINGDEVVQYESKSGLDRMAQQV